MARFSGFFLNPLFNASMRNIFSLLALVTLLTSGSVLAQNDPAVKAKLLIDIGLHYGGDEIATVVFQDGNEQDMLAGQGISLAVGGEFSVPSFKYAFLRTQKPACRPPPVFQVPPTRSTTFHKCLRLRRDRCKVVGLLCLY